MLNLVSAGLGVALVSASLQRMNIEGVVYRRLKGVAQLKVPLHLASRRGDTSTADFARTPSDTPQANGEGLSREFGKGAMMYGLR